MFHFSGSRVHKPMDSAYDDRGLTLSGYPIRTPPGLSSLAALRGFSQLVASFFACQHQGIHHKPLGSLYKVKPLVTRTFLNLSRVRFSILRICYFFVCLILFCNLCVSALHLEIVFFPQNCWSTNLAIGIYHFATRMSICRLPAIHRSYVREGVYGW